ncbi:MAG: hypothetical protein CMJ84_12575 [Planctomycetes bacterium]|nr:hypothetical protein [Planctomycetota bacterium]
MEGSCRFDSEYAAMCHGELKPTSRIGEGVGYSAICIVESNGEAGKRLPVVAKNLTDERAVRLE